MKKVLFALLFIPIYAFGQGSPYCCPFSETFPMIDGKVTYTDVIKEDGVSAPEFYKKAKMWIVDTFKSSKDVIQSEDPNNYFLVGKGFFEGAGHQQSVVNAKYWFTIKIECRDERYKYSISDFKYEFDVLYLGTETHFNKDFSSWGNTSFDDYYQNILDKKFPPGKDRTEKQQKKYEAEKEKLYKKQQKNYFLMKDHYSIIDAQIKTIINSLTESMKQSEEDEW